MCGLPTRLFYSDVCPLLHKAVLLCLVTQPQVLCLFLGSSLVRSCCVVTASVGFQQWSCLHPMKRVVSSALSPWLGWGWGRGIHPRGVQHRGPIPTLTLSTHVRDRISLTGRQGAHPEFHFMVDPTQAPVKAWGWGSPWTG